MRASGRAAAGVRQLVRAALGGSQPGAEALRAVRGGGQALRELGGTLACAGRALVEPAQPGGRLGQPLPQLCGAVARLAETIDQVVGLLLAARDLAPGRGVVVGGLRYLLSRLVGHVAGAHDGRDVRVARDLILQARHRVEAPALGDRRGVAGRDRDDLERRRPTRTHGTLDGDEVLAGGVVRRQLVDLGRARLDRRGGDREDHHPHKDRGRDRCGATQHCGG